MQLWKKFSQPTRGIGTIGRCKYILLSKRDSRYEMLLSTVELSDQISFIFPNLKLKPPGLTDFKRRKRAWNIMICINDELIFNQIQLSWKTAKICKNHVLFNFVQVWLMSEHQIYIFKFFIQFCFVWDPSHSRGCSGVDSGMNTIQVKSASVLGSY